MKLAIYAYGQPVLKKVGQAINKDYKDLDKLIESMWETMYNAHGIGLAAPQIGKSIRLFLVDTIQTMEEGEEEKGIKKVFINPEKIDETGSVEPFEEGCLSIPEIKGDVYRQPILRLKYLDENFVEHDEIFNGINARVIQHEYDHIEGILFTELLKPLKKQLIKRKLENIKKGKISPEYKMKFAVGRR